MSKLMSKLELPPALTQLRLAVAKAELAKPGRATELAAHELDQAIDAYLLAIRHARQVATFGKALGPFPKTGEQDAADTEVSSQAHRQPRPQTQAGRNEWHRRTLRR